MREPMKIHIGMLEDNAEEAAATKQMVERYFRGGKDEYSLDVFSSSADFMQQSFSKYDLLFLDILLEGEEITGMDIAEKVRADNSKIAIVFLTKSTHFAIEGYKVNAIDYIVKPLIYEEFLLKMHKILDIISHTIDRDIILKTLDGIVKVKESDILYLEVIRHYLHFHLKNGGTLVVRGAMKDYAEDLSSRFARSGNSFMVNLSHIDRVGKNDIFINDGEKLLSVPLTRSYREAFLSAFNSFNGA